MADYPVLHFHTDILKNNCRTVVDRCKGAGIQVAGVTKGVGGDLRIAKLLLEGGIEELASSRTEHLALYKKHTQARTLLLRIPMLSELDEVVAFADRSLQSDEKTLRALDALCKKEKKTHEVILMVDLGDLREGFYTEDDLFAAAQFVHKSTHLDLVGIGTNLGCYGSIRPTKENLGRLVRLAEAIESNIILKELPLVSGGATSSLTLLYDQEMPSRINHLRIGEGILLARDLTDLWGYNQENLSATTMTIEAQIIEIKEKPSYPQGEITIDAFGNRPTYTDRGLRRRALLALGKQDMGDHEKLIPLEEGVMALGSSSDHLIVDITDCKRPLVVGDTLSFYPYYQAMLYACQPGTMKKIYV